MEVLELVLSHYDGKTWRRDDAPVYAKPKLVDPDENDNSIGYTVMLEPHNQRWLYALEHLVDIDGTVNVSREMQLYTKNNITAKSKCEPYGCHYKHCLHHYQRVHPRGSQTAYRCYEKK